ncbi:MAG: DUF4157 domain-containing protein, partial [Myxococcota bacterium]
MLRAPRAGLSTVPAGGEALETATRVWLESRFGEPVGHVRIHRDVRAASLAWKAKANAYAAGVHIVFGATEYDPYSARGRFLLAHEVAHVLQQGNGAAGNGPAFSQETNEKPEDEKEKAKREKILKELEDVPPKGKRRDFIPHLSAPASSLTEADVITMHKAGNSAAAAAISAFSKASSVAAEETLLSAPGNDSVKSFHYDLRKVRGQFKEAAGMLVVQPGIQTMFLDRRIWTEVDAAANTPEARTGLLWNTHPGFAGFRQANIRSSLREYLLFLDRKAGSPLGSLTATKKTLLEMRDNKFPAQGTLRHNEWFWATAQAVYEADALRIRILKALERRHEDRGDRTKRFVALDFANWLALPELLNARPELSPDAIDAFRLQSGDWQRVAQFAFAFWKATFRAGSGGLVDLAAFDFGDAATTSKTKFTEADLLLEAGQLRESRIFAAKFSAHGRNALGQWVGGKLPPNNAHQSARNMLLAETKTHRRAMQARLSLRVLQRVEQPKRTLKDVREDENLVRELLMIGRYLLRLHSLETTLETKATTEHPTARAEDQQIVERLELGAWAANNGAALGWDSVKALGIAVTAGTDGTQPVRIALLSDWSIDDDPPLSQLTQDFTDKARIPDFRPLTVLQLQQFYEIQRLNTLTAAIKKELSGGTGILKRASTRLTATVKQGLVPMPKRATVSTWRIEGPTAAATGERSATSETKFGAALWAHEKTNEFTKREAVPFARWIPPASRPGSGHSIPIWQVHHLPELFAEMQAVDVLSEIIWDTLFAGQTKTPILSPADTIAEVESIGKQEAEGLRATAERELEELRAINAQKKSDARRAQGVQRVKSSDWWLWHFLLARAFERKKDLKVPAFDKDRQDRLDKAVSDLEDAQRAATIVERRSVAAGLRANWKRFADKSEAGRLRDNTPQDAFEAMIDFEVSVLPERDERLHFIILMLDSAEHMLASLQDGKHVMGPGLYRTLIQTSEPMLKTKRAELRAVVDQKKGAREGWIAAREQHLFALKSALDKFIQEKQRDFGLRATKGSENEPAKLTPVKGDDLSASGLEFNEKDEERLIATRSGVFKLMKIHHDFIYFPPYIKRADVRARVVRASSDRGKLILSRSPAGKDVWASEESSSDEAEPLMTLRSMQTGNDRLVTTKLADGPFLEDVWEAVESQRAVQGIVELGVLID